MDPQTGLSDLTVRNWQFLPTPETNGISFERDEFRIALGENTFRVPIGELRANRRLTRFKYRAVKRPGFTGIRSLRIVRRPDGWYNLFFDLRGLNLPTLLTQDPVCEPIAVIVGDDDGFTGVKLTRRSFTSARLRVQSACDSDNG